MKTKLLFTSFCLLLLFGCQANDEPLDNTKESKAAENTSSETAKEFVARIETEGKALAEEVEAAYWVRPVSYTHLTLPTKRIV